MLIHGLEIYKNLEYSKLLRIYICGDSIKKIRDIVLDSYSKFKLKKLGYWALRKVIKNNLKQLKYFQAEIIKTLTNARRPNKYIKYLTEIIIEAGISKKATDGDIPDPYNSILNIATFIAVRIGKTPKEIIDNLTPDQTPILLAEIAKKEIADQLNLVSATHSDPEKLFPKLQRQYRMADSKRRSALSNVREQIKEDKVVQIASFKDMVKAALNN